MNNKTSLFRNIVKGTSVLLVISALLAVLGVFDGVLDWDLFSSRTEKLLTAVFVCCMTLAAFGMALCSVQGMKAVVDAVRCLAKLDNVETEVDKKKSSRAFIYSLFLLLVVVVSFHVVNHFVLNHRLNVFKKIAGEQIQLFDEKIINIVQTFKTAPRGNVPKEFFDIFATIEDFPSVRKATIYIPDKEDEFAMWGYRAFRNNYDSKDGFAKFFVLKAFEKAMKKAIDGDLSELEKINLEKEFIFYYPVKDKENNIIAIIRIDGNPKEDFREY